MYRVRECNCPPYYSITVVRGDNYTPAPCIKNFTLPAVGRVEVTVLWYHLRVMWENMWVNH